MPISGSPSLFLKFSAVPETQEEPLGFLPFKISIQFFLGGGSYLKGAVTYLNFVELFLGFSQEFLVRDPGHLPCKIVVEAFVIISRHIPADSRLDSILNGRYMYPTAGPLIETPSVASVKTAKTKIWAIGGEPRKVLRSTFQEASVLLRIDVCPPVLQKLVLCVPFCTGGEGAAGSQSKQMSKGTWSKC